MTIDLYDPVGNPPIYPLQGSQFHDSSRFIKIINVQPKAQYMKNHVLFLSSTMKSSLTKTEEEALSHILNAGAKITTKYEKNNVTIAVVENRSQDEYRLAGLHNKYVLNKQWLINTSYREEFHAPTMTIMDYPLPIGAVPGSHNKVSSL